MSQLMSQMMTWLHVMSHWISAFANDVWCAVSSNTSNKCTTFENMLHSYHLHQSPTDNEHQPKSSLFSFALNRLQWNHQSSVILEKIMLAGLCWLVSVYNPWLDTCLESKFLYNWGGTFLGMLLAQVQFLLTGEENSMTSNIRDRCQISLLAPKKRERASFHSPFSGEVQCHISEKTSVGVVETANA